MQNLCACAQEISEKTTRHTWILARRGGPAIRITVYMRPRSFASPARRARTTRTKRKRRRNETDLTVTGGGQARLTPLNLRYTHIIYTYIYTYTCKNAYTPIKIPLGEGSDISIQEATEVCLFWGRTERTKKESNKTEPPPKKSVLGPHHN
jgi:hypothetical protein